MAEKKPMDPERLASLRYTLPLTSSRSIIIDWVVELLADRDHHAQRADEAEENSSKAEALREQLDLILRRLGWDGEATNEDPYEHADAVACALLEDSAAYHKAAREQVEILKGVIARAIEASNSIADRDAEDAIQEMLQHLLEAEPEGHDDRIEWARMEGANAMLEVIQSEGYGARGISDNRNALRRKAAELAVAATIPRNPEPEFEAAALQRQVEQQHADLIKAIGYGDMDWITAIAMVRVWAADRVHDVDEVQQLRAQLDEQREAADRRVDELTTEWRKEPDRMLALLSERTSERDQALRERGVLAQGLQALDEATYDADSEDFPEWVVVPIDDKDTGWYIEERYQDASHADGYVLGATILELHNKDYGAMKLNAETEAQRISSAMNAGMALARKLKS